jgi:zinc transporter, ZIP family
VLGFIAASPLLIGCVISLYTNLSQKVITTIMAFGSGVLVATLTFSILVEAFSVTHTISATATGFILGGLSFSIANLILERKSKSKEKTTTTIKHANSPENSSSIVEANPMSGRSLFVGSLMDNVPENAALGITLAIGGTINIAFLVAILIANLPTGLAATHAMKSSGQNAKHILALWSVAVIIATVATPIGYSILSYASPPIISISIAFSAGAILVMLAEHMIPEAFKQGGLIKGIALLAGFQIAVVLSALQGH